MIATYIICSFIAGALITHAVWTYFWLRHQDDAHAGAPQ